MFSSSLKMQNLSGAETKPKPVTNLTGIKYGGKIEVISRLKVQKDFVATERLG